MELSTPHIHQAALRQIARLAPGLQGEHLDIGAGHGELISSLRARYQLRSTACDQTADLMRLPDVPVAVADLDRVGLPFPDARFDLVTCTEVIEHLEYYRRCLRETWRVLKPGGIFVLSTPNILNLKSRVRFLGFGFHNLFGPLPFSGREVHATDGHINPVSCFYVAHSLAEAGFADICVTIDKRQRSSCGWLLLLGLPIWAISRLELRRERRRYRTLDPQNEPFVRGLNSLDVLLGRTIIVGARKPSA